MSQTARLEKLHYNQTFAMALRSCTTRRSPFINILVDPTGELDELAGAQGPAIGFNARCNKALIEAFTPTEPPTLLFVSLIFENLFTKFIKIFMERI